MENFIIRKANVADLEKCMQIIENAREYFLQKGIDQWQDGYPNKQNLMADYENGNWYVAENSEEIVATFMAALQNDETYEKIYNGNWLTNNQPYAVLHRIAVSPNAKGKGVGGLVLDFIAGTFGKQGAKSIRGDTHEDNISMRKMMCKKGFKECGTIYIESGAKRIGFEKLV